MKAFIDFLNEGLDVKFDELPADIIDTLKKIKSEKVISKIEVVNNTVEVTGSFRSFSTDELYVLTENRRFLKMIIEKTGNTTLIFQVNKGEL